MSSNAQAPSSPPPPLYISRLDVKLALQSKKPVQRIKIGSQNRTLKDFNATISPGESHKETFIPAIELLAGDPFSISLQHSTRWPVSKLAKIIVYHQEILSGAETDGETHAYRKSEGKVDVTIFFHKELPPTTRDIIQCCPRFRVLVIGNSGVGKSSLIKKLFGVADVHVADDTRGDADIEKEHISPQNQRFVLHDSKGFEEGDEKNIETVRQFVRSRKELPHIKDRLHAVWLCLETPYSDGRLLETGTEDFLRRRKDILGDIPLVVVLTKADLLDEQIEIEMMSDPDSRTFERRKEDFVKEHCIGHLREVGAGNVPHVLVSTKVPQKRMFAEITEITQDCVGKYIGDEASVLVAMAQRASIKVNIETSIAIGKKRYWSNLAKSAFFGGHTLQRCIQVLHEDIVTVWNFHDPGNLLRGEKFIGALLDRELAAAQKPDESNVNVATLFSIVDTAVWFVQLAHRTYQQTADDVKLLMHYIVSSMAIMQIVFLLAPEGLVTQEIIDGAIDTYSQLKRRYVHEQIDGVIKHGTFLSSDYVMNAVVALIRSCDTRNEEIQERRERTQSQGVAQGAGGRRRP